MTTEQFQLRAQILLAGGGPRFASELRTALAAHSVDLAHCVGSAATRTARGRTLDALVLELSDATPETIQEVRAEHDVLPILVHGPDIDEADIASLLNGGADGYVRRCGNPVELTARLCALLRRTETPCEI